MEIDQLMASIRTESVSAATVIDLLEDTGYGSNNYWDSKASVYRVDESRAIYIGGKDVRIGVERSIGIVVDNGKLVVDCDECAELDGLKLDCPITINEDSEHHDVLRVVEIVATYADIIPLEVEAFGAKIVCSVFFCA